MTQPAARTSWPLFQLVALLPQLRRAAAGLAFLCMLSGTLALVGCQSTAKPGTSAAVDMSGGDNDSGGCGLQGHDTHSLWGLQGQFKSDARNSAAGALNRL